MMTKVDAEFSLEMIFPLVVKINAGRLRVE